MEQPSGLKNSLNLLRTMKRTVKKVANQTTTNELEYAPALRQESCTFPAFLATYAISRASLRFILLLC